MSRYFQDSARDQNKRARTRAVLLDSALDVFAENGISNTRLESITKYAGMANATFYNHFKDKEELVTVLAMSIAAELLAPLGERLIDIKDSPTRIAAAATMVMRGALEQGSWGLVLGQVFYLVPPTYIDVGGYLKADIESGQEQGHFVVIPDQFQLDQVTSVFISGLRSLNKDDPKIIERTCQNMLRLLGMTPAKAALAQEKAEAFLL